MDIQLNEKGHMVLLRDGFFGVSLNAIIPEDEFESSGTIEYVVTNDVEEEFRSGSYNLALNVYLALLHSKQKELMTLDEVTDEIWFFIQRLARKMNIPHLTNDEFTNEDILNVRRIILEQLQCIKEDRQDAFKKEMESLPL